MRKFDYSKYKDFTWDSEMLSKISNIYYKRGKIEQLMLQNPLIFEKMIPNTTSQSVIASNAIEGIVTTNFRFKNLLNDNTLPSNRSEQEIKGYINAHEVINDNYKYIEVNKNYILQLHNILYKEVPQALFGGRFKNFQNYIRGYDNEGNIYNLFTPLAPYETPKAIELICNQYNNALEEENINLLIISLIFILDFLSIHPFNDGNGRMSRLLTNLLLYRLGYSIGKYISLENKINNSKELYYNALYESQKGWHEGNNNPLPFINYMLEIIESSYIELDEKVSLLNQDLSAYEMVKRSLSNKIGRITKTEVIELLPILSPSSIEKSIHRLVKEEKLEKQGVGKATFYIIKNFKW